MSLELRGGDGAGQLPGSGVKLRGKRWGLIKDVRLNQLARNGQESCSEAEVACLGLLPCSVLVTLARKCECWPYVMPRVWDKLGWAV